ncbi:uncharacterized protein LOC120350999 [Nilaparvata lugens]|uniref:uncharacterized protein LOC120350999 n=1 Tax=Nilaparvata lugens TaxID=108931 RepID=UPI00193E9F21|nr:uncharacterized protein LOC120350999 [Nilaparvata lugens]
MQHIMDNIRTHGIDNDPRALLIDRVDLHNIKRDYNIDYCTKLHNDDETSITLWVQKMAELKEDSPVLIFKNQDFLKWKFELRKSSLVQYMNSRSSKGRDGVPKEDFLVCD